MIFPSGIPCDPCAQFFGLADPSVPNDVLSTDALLIVIFSSQMLTRASPGAFVWRAKSGGV